MSTNQVDRGAASGVFAIPSRPAISDEVPATAERLGVGQYLATVIAFTVEIFGSFRMRVSCPIPKFLTLCISSSMCPVTGSVDDILGKDMLWCRRLLATIPRAPRIFSIAMNYQE